MKELIVIHRDERIANLVINRPERRNALGTELMSQLSSALKALKNDVNIHALVFRGAENVFCAGSDLKELAELDVKGMAKHEAETAKVVRDLLYFPKPTFAALEGYALGGGYALAMSCDLVVASESAKLAMPEVLNGWCPPWGLTAISRRCSPIHAQRIVWGAEAFSLEDLVRMGAIDYLSPEGQAVEKANEIAGKYLKLPAEAVESVKKFFSKKNTDAVQDDRWCSEAFMENCNSQEAENTLKKFKK